MAEAFNFDANQYFDFCQMEASLNEDSFTFFVGTSNEKENECANGSTKLDDEYQDIEESQLSNTESDNNMTFYTPGRGSALRRSISLNNLSNRVQEENEAMNQPVNKQTKLKSGSSASLNKVSKAASRDHINRLAKPKSQNNLNVGSAMTLAEAVTRFQVATPKRFRSKVSPKLNKQILIPWGGTKGKSPKLQTTARIRPVTVISRQEQENLEAEEARKFKIRANPVNPKILKGPLKPQVEKKPPTQVEPFHLTDIKKKEKLEELKIPPFRAQPIPKTLNNPFTIQPTNQPLTEAHTPNFSRKPTKQPPKIDNVAKNEAVSKPFKPTRTEPKPFSFEKRDQQLQKKKEEFIHKVIEEEKKAREFHANPLPKNILRTRNGSLDRKSNLSSTKSLPEELREVNGFRARPPKVLSVKPFEPKKDEMHTLKIEPFQFLTEERQKSWQKFQKILQEKEASNEASRREREEKIRQIEEAAAAELRKQTEYKAQPIKKYKPITIVPSNKLTEPVSPKFHTGRIRNKENIEK